MTIKNALHAEVLKMRRTLALKMVPLAPLVVISLTVFMVASAPFSTLHPETAHDDWKAFIRLNLLFWGFLMMPLYITLQTALLAGLDHTENQWKAILARPVPRWTVYVAKLLVLSALTIAAGLLLVACILLAGAGLHLVDAKVRLGSPLPFTNVLDNIAKMVGLAFLALTIQHWVSLQWKTFSVGIGFGIVATITAFAMVFGTDRSGSWSQYFPWALPMLVLDGKPHDTGTILWISITVGIAVTLLGCVSFSRREVT